MLRLNLITLFFLASFFINDSVIKPGNSRYKLIYSEAGDFCNQHNLNIDFFFLIDLKIHSGKNRFFIVDLTNENILNSSLVSHGCCNGLWGETETKDAAGISNLFNSHCSSIGKYSIGERGYSNWGIHIKYYLQGLDASNSNAYKREIVMHSWELVSDSEVFPDGTPEGWGCPALPNEMMKLVDEKLKRTNKAVLLWILN